VLDRKTHPDIWAESFDVPHAAGDSISPAGVNIDGFLRQCAPIARSVEAGVEYGLDEGWNIVVEGVHLVPGTFAVPERNLQIVAELHTVADLGNHRELFTQRDIGSNGKRPAEHYHRNLDRIHDVQQLLIDRWGSWEAGERVTLERVDVTPLPR
jgi:2-phosphoglycerate kinase